ncbi:MAG: MoaD/ThiS family protein [Clostridiales bacterium]|jgi:molybdopterin converting factor small subunit|nr:MoaD/ThiS family protein [Clostridiales bacterium]HOB64984.1 MoaD/ThiS family protein [Clostridia bacterium]
MITVSLYGLYRLKATDAKYEFEGAKDVKHLLTMVEQASGIPYKELKQAVIFVNGSPIDQLDMFSTKLHGGDVISIVSPASGG